MRPPKDIPLLLRGPLVCAFLAGQKTVTRRTDLNKWRKAQPGDRIWFRETWRPAAWRDDGRMAIDYRATPEQNRVGTPWVFPPVETFQKMLPRVMQECEDAYKRDPDTCWPGDECSYNWERGNSPCKWRPSIFMPKWAARCWAVIEDIREERLQDITEEDAKREGILERVGGFCCEEPVSDVMGDSKTEFFLDAVRAFEFLWDSINGKKPGLSWDDNPTVARIQFRRIEAPTEESGER